MTDDQVNDRPEWAGPRTNTGAGHHLADERFDVYVVEHYEIVDPDLPYQHRFRLLGHTLNVRLTPAGEDPYDDDTGFRESLPVTSADLYALASSISAMADQAAEDEREDAAARRARGEVPPPDGWRHRSTGEVTNLEPEDPGQWMRLYREAEA